MTDETHPGDAGPAKERPSAENAPEAKIQPGLDGERTPEGRVLENAALPDALPANGPAEVIVVDEEVPPGLVQRYLLYTLSLPERAIRSSVGVVGGVAKEASGLLLPQAFRDSKTYQVMVAQMLDFMVEDVAADDAEAAKVENFVARKTVGNFVETASVLTFHVSPLTVLAVLSDVAYGSNAFLRELSAELKQQGLIDETSTIHHVDDLLDAVAHTSGQTASARYTPPLSAEGLRATIEQDRTSLRKLDPTKLIPQAELQRMWQEMSEIAQRENVGLLSVSGAMAMHVLGKVTGLGRGMLSGVTAAGNLFERHILGHYASAVCDLKEKGFYRTLAEVSGPYTAAVWNNFSSTRGTVTEDVVSGRFFGRMWLWLRGVFGRKAVPAEVKSETPAVVSPANDEDGNSPPQS